MLFASALFLCLFLPLTLAAYFMAPRKARNAVLLVASVAFYLWGEGWYITLVAASVLANWLFGLRIGKTEDPGQRKRWLAAAVATNLAVLVVFKYTGFATENLNALLVSMGVAPLALAHIALPLGISFFTFHAISYVVDVYKRNAHAERSLPDFALYILLFPQLIAGPIIRWRDIARQLTQRQERVADFAEGTRRFILGLGKKVLVANPLGLVADQIFALPAQELSAPVAWLGLACYTLQIYFDFSGYSDMACGLMRMFGFRILENFNYPYVSRSVREFWRRWHISLSNWFRDYLYVPLGGNRQSTLRVYANLALVFLLCGLWHGATWPFVLWGAWHGVFLVLERAGLSRLLERGPAALQHAYALLAVMGAWVLFRCETLTHASVYYAALAGLGDTSTAKPPLTQYLDAAVAATLVLGVLGAMPLARHARRVLTDLGAKGRTSNVVAMTGEVLYLAAILVAATAWLAAGTYNPFIYFRF